MLEPILVSEPSTVTVALMDVSSPDFAIRALTTDAQTLLETPPLVQSTESVPVLKGVWNKVIEIEQKLKGNNTPIIQPQTQPQTQVQTEPAKRNFRKTFLGF